MNPNNIAKGLYAISPDIDVADAVRCRQFIAQLEQMLDSGLSLFQLRSKAAESTKKSSLAKTCRRLCHEYQTPFIINDDVKLAKQCDADGVHVGQGDSAVAQVRKQLGKNAIIGVSCHGDLVLAGEAIDQGANYVAFGRFFPSNTKPDAPPADIRVLQRAKYQFHVPIVAIGGIRVSNANYVLDAGADLLAMIDGLFNSDDLSATLSYLQGLFRKSRHPAANVLQPS